MDIVQSSDQPLCLPEEIIEEILSRIPVKSLLKFRCVSKKWRSLIGAKRFFKAHLEKSMKNPSFERHKVIARTMPPYYELKHYSLHSLLNDPSTDSSAIDDSVDVEVGTVCVVGCCDGLVCILLDRRDFVLWNPSTRMSRKLPDLHDKIKNGLIVKYGFGCNESNGDYKVFAVFSLFGTCWEYGTIGKVYSLKRNSWRVIDENNAFPFGEGGEFVKGKLHWGRGHGGEGWDIVSLDLQSEVYGMVEQPSYLEGDFYRKLGVLGGCLSVFISSHRSHVDVWVMKEYGVKESWCKFVRVPHFDGPHEIATLPTPFAIGPNGEIMLVCESSFVVYYPEDGMFRHPRVANFAPFREVGVYVESLACLSHEDQEEEEESCMKDGIMS